MAGQSGAIRAGAAFVEIFTKQTGLEKGLQQASKKLRAFGGSVASAGTSMMGIGAAIVAPLIGAAKVFSDTGSAMWDMSKRTGMTVEALSGLGYAAEQSGAGMESFETGVRRMQRSIYDAGRGTSTAVDALKDLGLSYKDLDGLSPEDQFKLIADRLDGVTDPTRKAALAMAIFGRSGTQLLPMLEGGAVALNEYEATAKRLGLVMSTEDAAAADKFGDTMTDLWRTLQRCVFTIGAALAPVLSQMATAVSGVIVQVSQWIRQNQSLIVGILQVGAGIAATGAVLFTFGKAVQALGVSFAVLGTAITLIKGIVIALVGVVGLFVSPIGLVMAAIAGLVAYVAYATGAAGQIFSWFGGVIQTLKDDFSAAFKGISDAMAAGDIALAAKILWATVQLEWQRGVNFLTRLWIGFQNGFGNLMSSLGPILVEVGQRIVETLAAAGIAAGLAIASGIANGLEAIQIARAAAKEKEEVEKQYQANMENLESKPENYYTPEDRAKVKKSIELQRSSNLSAIDQNASEQLSQRSGLGDAGKNFAGKLGDIWGKPLENKLDTTAIESAVNGVGQTPEEQAQFEAQNADIARLRQERDALLAQAKGGAKASDGPDLPDAPKVPKGVDTTLSNLSKNGMTQFGGQYASMVFSGGAIDRIATASEETAKNTKPLRNGSGTPTFAN